MKNIETRPREIGFVLWDHCQNLLDDPRSYHMPEKPKYFLLFMVYGFVILWFTGVCIILFF